MSTKNDFDEQVTPRGDDTKFELQINLDQEVEAINWSEHREQYDPRGKKVNVAELIGTEIDIIKLRKFESSFEGQPYAYWCVVRRVDNNEIYNTVIGGSALINDIDAYLATGMVNPMRVTIVQETGGRYGRYYVFA